MLIVDVLTNFFGQLIIMNNFAFDTLPLKWLEDTFPVGWWVVGWVFSSTVRAQVEDNTFKPISIILQEGGVIYMNINNK